MKKQLLFAFILLLLVNMESQAQTTKEFAPVGAEWYYQYNYLGPDGYTNSYVKFECTGKTDINGWNCSIITEFYKRFCGQLMDSIVAIHYLYQSGEQIYEVENDEKYILYDFSKEVGESWYLPKYDDTVSVLEKKIMFLDNGDSCIRLTISNLVDESPWYFCGYLNNCFGREHGTLFPDPQTTGAGGVNEIRCYLMDGEMIYKEGVYACEYDYTSVDIALFPMEDSFLVQNPVNDRISIRLTDPSTAIDLSSVVIYNTLGKIVKNEEIDLLQGEISIPFADVPQGIYLIRLNLKNGNGKTFKIVKL